MILAESMECMQSYYAYMQNFPINLKLRHFRVRFHSSLRSAREHALNIPHSFLFGFYVCGKNPFIS